MIPDWPAGYGQRLLGSVDSTNAEAMRIAGDAQGPTWIMAGAQTAARGRRGRGWMQPKGNFGASLLLPGLSNLAEMGLRSFTASLALYDALRLVGGPNLRLNLKWPNDVLLSGGKLAGILLETVPNGLVIGVGVNLAETPPTSDLEAGALLPVSFKEETGLTIDTSEFLTCLAACYAPWEQKFVQYGFDPIREAWLARAAKLGEVIKARTMKEEVTGVFSTVDPSGHLVLTTAEGRIAIPAADVFFE